MQEGTTQPRSGTKQLSVGQAHARTAWLLSGAQPQAPTLQVLGKSLVAWQHCPVCTVPPVASHRLRRARVAAIGGISTSVAGTVSTAVAA